MGSAIHFQFFQWCAGLKGSGGDGLLLGAVERKDQPRPGAVPGSGQASDTAQVLNPEQLYGPRAALNGSMEMLNNLHELVCKFQTMREKAVWIKICDFSYNL